jgi:CHAT domain-containing protein
LLAATQDPDGRWKELSIDLGNQILAGTPLRPHMILVPDGPLNIPFEILSIPGSDALLVEKSDVTYLPSARFLGSAGKSDQRWFFPWGRQLVAFGDPPLSSFDALAEKEKWQRLPASVEEVREISRILPGSAEIHLGSDARKLYLLDRHIEGVPLLHFGTHAIVDIENPDRSRILLASNSSSAEYLFQQEVYDLDLRNVGLVTLSACDTARGKVVRGEGMQAFSQAFFAAGASATVTSLWKVDDGPTASFMKQFYYFLGRNRSKAEALQEAKLRFLRSNSPLSSPRYWAAFVLYGDGWNPTRRVVPWSVLLFAVAGVLMMVSFVLWRFWTIKAEKKEVRTAGQFPPRRLPGIQTPVVVDQKKP